MPKRKIAPNSIRLNTPSTNETMESGCRLRIHSAQAWALRSSSRVGLPNSAIDAILALSPEVCFRLRRIRLQADRFSELPLRVIFSAKLFQDDSKIQVRLGK